MASISWAATLWSQLIEQAGDLLFNRRYRVLAQADSDSDTALPNHALEKDQSFQRIQISPLQTSSLFVYWNIALFCLSVLMLTWSILRSYGLGITEADHKRAWYIVNAPSPILDAIELPLRMREMKGSVVNVDNDILRQPPSDEVDKAWEDIIDHEVSWVSSGDLHRLGKDPEVSVKIPPEYGVGDDAYAVETDMLHKIHCLNRIRKDVYFDHYYLQIYPDRVASELHQWHTNHCIYILLQSLMCDASTDLIPLVWREMSYSAAQDFNLARKCGNFAGIKQWTKERSIPYDDIYNMTMPAGQKVAPMNAEFERILHQPDPELPWIENHTIHAR